MHTRHTHFQHFIWFETTRDSVRREVDNNLINKYVFSLIAIVIGMAFLASCEQSETSGTSTTITAAMRSPLPTPASKRAA